MNTRSKVYYAVGAGLLLAAGIWMGWWAFDTTSVDGASEVVRIAETPAGTVWTCSMHPQIRQEHPGKCPLCAMDLIPLKTADGGAATEDRATVRLSEAAAALADVRTSRVGRGRPVKEIRLYGTVKPNERGVHPLVAHASGRIEALYINYAGERVRAGEVVATVYSPELLHAQQELIEAGKLAATQPELLIAAREKLRYLKWSERQIAAVEASGEASATVDMVASVGGTVIAKRVELGDYVRAGSVLFELADLSSVWVLFDAYVSDLPYLKVGDRVEYRMAALPGRVFVGRIARIDPALDAATRTAKVRVEAANPQLEVMPEMYADGVVRGTSNRGREALLVPKTAVLWTGKRSIVYVRELGAEMPTFRLREIELGAALGEDYVVLSGLDEGEEVVSSGAFAVDAVAQLEGKESMMNRAAATTRAELRVQGLCGMCRERIETAARGVSGVSEAAWDSETGVLVLRLDARRASVDAVARAVARVGHDTEGYKAEDGVYEGLPGCCRYRGE
jgi:Cu(I)/Ag(I) efflux system membrane fusion protein